jgi:hypothetical protein
MEAWMRYLLACVMRDAHCLKKLQDEILDHPDCHLVAEFYEAPYPETMATSELTFLLPTVNMSVAVAVIVEWDCVPWYCVSYMKVALIQACL